jgi:hypothetical protein
VGDEVKKDDDNGAYGTFRRGEMCKDRFGRETEGKRPLGRPSYRWENIIKMDLQEIGRDGNWIDVTQNRDRWRAFVKTVMNPPIPYNAGNSLTG